MTQTLSTTTPASPLTGTNFWVNLLLLIGSAFGGLSGDTAGMIVAAVSGLIGAVFAVRNWVVNAKFNLGKSWIADPNNWAYLTAVVVALIPQAAELLPALRSLADALISGNWSAILTAGFSLLTMIYYTFIKRR